VVYTADFHKCKGNYLEKIFTQYFDRAKSLNTLSKILYVDTKTWLVDDLLLKADKMTMAASVELRVPFLDHKLIENVAAMPSEFKIKNGAGKYILKRAMENHLPQHIIYRKKMGFPVPIGQWFAGQLHEIAREILMDSFTKRGYIRRQYVEKLFQEHGDGHANHSRRIFSLLNLEMWLKKYIEA
jgi:asparagine synthase (glutamine-hydrolysing)